MADDDIDIEGEFDFKLETGDGLYDANELPSKSANLLPEFTNPPWMLEQGWSLDNCMDEKSKATIEKMLLEEQQYINGRKKGKYLGINKSVLLITASTSQRQSGQEPTTKRQWTDEEKKMFLRGLEQFGRSWSKIARLIPSRTTMQVKNYAQQYMKNLAKRNELGRLEFKVTDAGISSLASAPAAATSSPATATVTSATYSLSDAVAAVSTAQPTVVARPHSTPVKPRSKSVKRKISSPKDSGHNVMNTGESAKSLLGKRQSGSAVSLVNELLNGNGVTLTASISTSEISSLDVEQNLKHESILGSASRPLSNKASKILTLKKELTSDSESDEIDVDIENVDGDENAIMQSRSTSPSSVYNRLLQQANVAADSITDTPQDHETEEEKMELPMVVNDVDEMSNSAAESDDCLTQSSDNTPSSSGSSHKAEVSAAGGGEEEGELVEEKLSELHEVKHFVNGVIASSGEVFEFPIPIEDKVLQVDCILEEEKMVHSEFFDGRPLKTPERYLKIRNYILDCWKKSRPGYLNKTSVRPGLKNCGDVNCIGRIHAYLECTGAINFGCEQAAYNNPGRGATTLARNKHSGKDYHPVMSAAKLESMRPRKRRIRDSSGHWVDEKELEGKTIEHKPEKEGPGKSKSSRGPKVVYDPFKLVPCQPFTLEKQAPFRLDVFSTALAVMDIHAHISRTEVIGMLGGQFDPESSLLTISIAVPCKSISTGMQCEMDPVSQTHASEQIEDVGMQVVGWYHSHPTFAPNPSVRDIETQQKFQYWFAKGGSHFVGIIISPYSPQNTSVISHIQCLTIGEDVAREFLCNRPYQFSYEVAYRDSLREILGPASELAEKYSTYNSRVALSCVYKPSLGITCLSKMLQSVKHRLEPPDPEHPIPGSRRKVEDVLHWLEQIFLEKFSPASSASSGDVDIAPMTTAVPPTDDDESV